MAEDDDPRRKFLIDSFDLHVDHIRVGQARRFEILRYSFIGFFAYYAFLMSVDNKQFLCVYPFESVVLIPSFLLFQVALYIWIVNWNINKHGAYIKYLFEEGLGPLGMGPNLYREFMEKEHLPANPIAGLFEKLSLHVSQVVLLTLAVATLLLYGYVESSGGFDAFASCGLAETS